MESGFGIKLELVETFEPDVRKNSQNQNPNGLCRLTKVYELILKVSGMKFELEGSKEKKRGLEERVNADLIPNAGV